MKDAIFLLAIVVVATALVIVLHANVALAEMSLMFGATLERLIHSETEKIVASSFPMQSISSSLIAGLMLLLLPTLLSIAFTMGRGMKRRRNLHMALAPGFGISVAYLLIPILPSGLRSGLTSASFFDTTSTYMLLIVLLSGIFSILVLSNGASLRHHDKSHHKQ